ncbi:uncharacterized protein LOC135544588 isoform X2 [Oncorhynchus masou masou]|uniref:uncharacterized protein LOC135544588 isoform X2 n=1 Tax=Oncorhynchus masou masou TaxID=90313 RepID=UPI0031845AB4
MDMISVLFNALALLSVLRRTGARTSSPNTTPSGPGPSTSDLRGQMFTVSYSYSIGFTMYTDAIFPSPSPTIYPSPSTSTSSSPSSSSASSPYSSPSTSPSPSTSTSSSPSSSSAYSPYSSPSTFPSPSSSPSSTPYTSHSPSTSSSPSSPYTSYPYTTPSPSPSLSALTVCLRYMAEEGKDLTLFSLTQGNYWNLLLERNSGMDYLSTHSSSQSFRSYRLLWSITEPRPWTSLCVTWEKNTGVAQVWRGRTVSIRKRVFGQVTNGPPVLKVFKFEGQVTDVEVWDSVLSPSWIMSYMSGWQSYWSYTPGNVLTWSKAIYSTNGEVLLERNTYNSDHQPIRGQRQHPRPMRRKKMRKCEWKKRARAEQIARTRP